MYHFKYFLLKLSYRINNSKRGVKHLHASKEKVAGGCEANASSGQHFGQPPTEKQRKQQKPQNNPPMKHIDVGR